MRLATFAAVAAICALSACTPEAALSPRDSDPAGAPRLLARTPGSGVGDSIVIRLPVEPITLEPEAAAP